MQDKTIQVTAYLLETLHAKLATVAKSEQRSVSNMIVIAVSEFIAKPENVEKWSTNPRDLASRQMDITDAIAAAVKQGPVTTVEKQASHRKNLADRAARMAYRTSKHK